MPKMNIYDPAMCCATGVCGLVIDQNLLRVATVISNLENNGISVERFNLSQNPQAFVDNQKVNDLLNKDGVNVLPVTLVDGLVVKTGEYPTDEEFIQWLKIPASLLSLGQKNGADACSCNGGCC